MKKTTLSRTPDAPLVHPATSSMSNMPDLHLMTLRHPWMHMILHGKDIENRTRAWNAMRSGDFWVAFHGGKYTPTPKYHAEMQAAFAWMEERGIITAGWQNRPLGEFVHTGIHAVGRIAAIQPSSSPWGGDGKLHYHLVDVRALPTPMPYTGVQFVRRLPETTAKQLWALYEAGTEIQASHKVKV